MDRLRIALVQPEFEGSSRAAALQCVLSLIDQAAEHDPAPDLIVLPAFADVDQTRGGEVQAERIVGQTTAALGQRAKSWGVFIAYGQAEQASDGRLHVTSVLLDNDGDVRLTHRQTTFEGAADPFTIGVGVAAVTLLIGRVALMTGDDVFDGTAWEQAAASGAQLIVASLSPASQRAAREAQRDCLSVVEDRARRSALPVALAGVSCEGSDRPGLTAWISPSGVQFRSLEGKQTIHHLEWTGLTPPEDLRRTVD